MLKIWDLYQSTYKTLSFLYTQKAGSREMVSKYTHWKTVKIRDCLC